MPADTKNPVLEWLQRQQVVAARLGGVAQERFGLTPTGIALLAMAVVGWLLARVIGSRSVFLLVYGALMVAAMAWLLGRRRLAITATRSELSPRLSAGQVVEVGLEITARRRVSNVTIEEMLPPELGLPVRVPITELAAKKSTRHVYRFTPRYRGVYDVGPMTVTWGDPFGLTKRRAPLTGPTEVIVHPVTEPVRDRVVMREWEDPPIRPPVSKPWPTGFDFYGMRDYVFGDDPRRINWRATARMIDPVTGAGRYLVRESEQGITDRVCLILDTNARTHSPGRPSDTFEAAVTTVASLAVRHLKDGFSVTVEANSRTLVNRLRGERNRIRLLDELARVQLEPVPLAESVRRMAADRRRLNLHNVLVTANLDEEAAARIRLMADHTSMLVAVVIWPDSDPTSMRRAASLGCNVVELNLGAPLEKAFRRVVGAGVRREH